MYVHDLDLFVTVQILDDTPAVLSLGKLCEEHGFSNEWASGQSPHLAPVRLLRRYSRTHQEHLQVQQKCGVTIQHQETGAIAQKLKANKKKGQKMGQWETACETSQRGFRSSQISKVQKCLQSDTFLMTEIRNVPQKWHPRSAVFSIHFPKDRNCEVWLRIKRTRAPCRKRAREGNQVLWADKFGDMITADHQVLNEGGDSRNNHRYSVMVRDLATEWVQSGSCKTKTSQETERSLRKFLEPPEKPKVIYTDKSLEFGESCEDLS